MLMLISIKLEQNSFKHSGDLSTDQTRREDKCSQLLWPSLLATKKIFAPLVWMPHHAIWHIQQAVGRRRGWWLLEDAVIHLLQAHKNFASKLFLIRQLDEWRGNTKPNTPHKHLCMQPNLIT